MGGESVEIVVRIPFNGCGGAGGTGSFDFAQDDGASEGHNRNTKSARDEWFDSCL
jgi:hypothetical protein